jgi:hypothetical protein
MFHFGWGQKKKVEDILKFKYLSLSSLYHFPSGKAKKNPSCGKAVKSSNGSDHQLSATSARREDGRSALARRQGEKSPGRSTPVSGSRAPTYGAGRDGAAGELSPRDQSTRCSPRVSAARVRSTDRGAKHLPPRARDAMRLPVFVWAPPTRRAKPTPAAEGRERVLEQTSLALVLPSLPSPCACWRLRPRGRRVWPTGRMARAAVVALLAIAVLLACLPPAAASSYRGGT